MRNIASRSPDIIGDGCTANVATPESFTVAPCVAPRVVVVGLEVIAAGCVRGDVEEEEDSIQRLTS